MQLCEDPKLFKEKRLSGRKWSHFHHFFFFFFFVLNWHPSSTCSEFCIQRIEFPYKVWKKGSKLNCFWIWNITSSYFLLAAQHYKQMLSKGLSQDITSLFPDQTPLKSWKAGKCRSLKLPTIILVMEMLTLLCRGGLERLGKKRDWNEIKNEIKRGKWLWLNVDALETPVTLLLSLPCAIVRETEALTSN